VLPQGLVLSQDDPDQRSLLAVELLVGDQQRLVVERQTLIVGSQRLERLRQFACSPAVVLGLDEDQAQQVDKQQYKAKGAQPLGG
jgi:hypothetical protein